MKIEVSEQMIAAISEYKELQQKWMNEKNIQEQEYLQIKIHARAEGLVDWLDTKIQMEK